MNLRWAFVGIMALALGCKSMDKSHDEDRETDEVKMTLAEVPPPVRETLTREAGGAAITEVDKESEDGKTIYETDVTIDGKKWEIKVDETGKLISKKEEMD